MRVKLNRTQAIVASIALGLFATLLLQMTARAGGRTVLVVTRPVPLGQAVSTQDISAVSGAPRALAAHAIAVLGAAVGHTARVALVPGQVLVQGDLGPPLQQGLHPGEEGIIIPADLVSSGGALPGDYVNVRVVPGQTSSGISTSLQPTTSGSAPPLLTHVRVVAVYNASGQPITAHSAGNTFAASNVPAAVELAVQPAQASLLAAYEGARLLLTIAPWASTTSAVTTPQAVSPLLQPVPSAPTTSHTP